MGPLVGSVASAVIRGVHGVARGVTRDLVSLLHVAAPHSGLVVETMELLALRGQQSRHLVRGIAFSESPLIPMHRRWDHSPLLG